MTLKEKFIEIVWWFNVDKVLINNQSQKCEIIANKYAIGFKDWCDNEGRFVIGTNTTKELLTIYKKEKGL